MSARRRRRDVLCREIYRVITSVCPYEEGEAVEGPPRFEGWSEDGQFEADAAHYLPDHDVALLNNPDNPSALHFNGGAGWYSFDAGAPTAMTQFSYQCSGDCPGFIIEYTDEVRPDWVSTRRSRCHATSLHPHLPRFRRSPWRRRS
jgi:hypothetical protein